MKVLISTVPKVSLMGNMISCDIGWVKNEHPTSVDLTNKVYFLLGGNGTNSPTGGGLSIDRIKIWKMVDLSNQNFY